jgi:hypothetical protein
MATLQAAIDKANGYAYGGRGAVQFDSVLRPEDLIPLMEERYRHGAEDHEHESDGDGGAGEGDMEVGEADDDGERSFYFG